MNEFKQISVWELKYVGGDFNTAKEMFMKKRIWLGILVMVLVFGMTVIGCDNDPDDDYWWERIDETLPDVEMTGDWTTLNVEFEGNVIELSRPSGTVGSLDGVWTGILDGTSIVVTFTGANWITRDTDGNDLARGTVTISGSNVSITITYLMVSGGYDARPPTSRPLPPPQILGNWVQEDTYSGNIFELSFFNLTHQRGEWEAKLFDENGSPFQLGGSFMGWVFDQNGYNGEILLTIEWLENSSSYQIGSQIFLDFSVTGQGGLELTYRDFWQYPDFYGSWVRP